MSQNTALLLIDVQNGFFNKEFGLYKSEEVLKNITLLHNKARESNVKIIYIQHLFGNSVGIQIDGTEMGNIHSNITPKEDDIIIQKKTPNSFYQTNLHNVLQENQIENLIVAGFQTEFCIDTTIRQAYSLGYKVILASDAHSTFNSELFKAEDLINYLTYIYSKWFAKLIPTEEIKF